MLKPFQGVLLQCRHAQRVRTEQQLIISLVKMKTKQTNNNNNYNQQQNQQIQQKVKANF